MAVFVLLAAYIVWYAEDRNYSGQLKEKDETIAALTAQVKELQQALIKENPQSPLVRPAQRPGADNSNFIDDMKQNAQDQFNDLSNQVNDSVNDTINDIQTETHNAATNISNDMSKSYHNSKRKTHDAANNVGDKANSIR